MASTARYLATCTTGLEVHLATEVSTALALGKVLEASKGRVIFESDAPPAKVQGLLMADDIYAHVRTVEGVPIDKEPGLDFLTDVAREVRLREGTLEQASMQPCSASRAQPCLCC